MNALTRPIDLRREVREELAAEISVAAYEAAEKARKFAQALSNIREDASIENWWCANIVRLKNERLDREAYELERAARNDDRMAAA